MVRPGSGTSEPSAGAVLRGALGETFEVTGELGRGGMGVVLRARDPGTGREVALKLARPTTERALLLRLEREGQLAARLSHPGIVRVHGAGTIGDRPYVAYELVEGARTLAEALPRLDRGARVAIVRDVARALGAAHALGVVHRDVKPENVLLGADGRPRVSDFGIATAADVERLTVTGAFIGTAHYMAPEQLLGIRGGVGPPSDVWSLGVTLYQCLTDALPFDGQSLVEVVGKVADGEPTPPRRLRPDVPADLEAVCLKALGRAPTARYPEAGAMADDLERALAGRPVEAGRPRRAVRRAVGAGLGALALAGLAASALAPTAAGPGAVVAPTAAGPTAAGPTAAGRAGPADPAALRRLLAAGDARTALALAEAALVATAAGPGADPSAEAALRQVGAEAGLACEAPERALRLAAGLPEGPERVAVEAAALLDLGRADEAARRAIDGSAHPAAALTRARALLVAGDASGARTALRSAKRLGATVGDEERLLPLLEGWAEVLRALARLGDLTTQIEHDRPDPRAVAPRLDASLSALEERLARPTPWLRGLPRRLQVDVWTVVGGLLALEEPGVARTLGRLRALDPANPPPPELLVATLWWSSEHGATGQPGPLRRVAALDARPLDRPLRFAAQALVAVHAARDDGGPRDEASLRLALAARADRPDYPGAQPHERALVRRLEGAIGECAAALAWSARADAAARARHVATAREHLSAFRELERAHFGAERRSLERALLATTHLLEAEVEPAADLCRSLLRSYEARSLVPDERARAVQVEVALQSGDLEAARAALAIPVSGQAVELRVQAALLAALGGDRALAEARLEALQGQPAQLLPWRSAAETRRALAAGWRPGQRPWVE